MLQHVKLYGFTNFVADIGGYLGLFLGASMLSICDGITAWLTKPGRGIESNPN